MVDAIDMSADASTMPLDGLDPETEYGIVFTPLRMVGNIETSMGTYDLALKTAAIPTANEAERAYIVTFDGRVYKTLSLPAGEYSERMPQGSYIIHIGKQSYKLNF